MTNELSHSVYIDNGAVAILYGVASDLVIDEMLNNM